MEKKTLLKLRFYWKQFTKGLWSENPVFSLLLALCPTLAISTMIVNSLAMGISVIIVMVISSILVSLLKNFIPETIRVPAYITMIATLVTIIEMLMKAYFPFFIDSLGIFIPLITVNCIILGRARAFAVKNNPLNSLLDSLGMGIGFLLALIIISTIREILGRCWIDFTALGATSIFTIPAVDPDTSQVLLYILGKKFEIYSGAFIFISPAGAFFIMGLILALLNSIKSTHQQKELRK